MEFHGVARIFKVIPNVLRLTDVWSIDQKELSELGNDALKLLGGPPEPLSSLSQQVAWQGQGLVECQDLQALAIPVRGRWLNNPFLFLQALYVLRQVVIAGLNGQIHLALAGLRSALEAFTFHYWWSVRLGPADNYEPFYEWLSGSRGNIPFRQAVDDVFSQLPYPPEAISKTDFNLLYATLCSYAHKPILDESLLAIRGGNFLRVDSNELFYWLSLLAGTQRVMLDMAVSHTPLALFPVDLYRKFGFNPPVGVFIDRYSGPIFERALGKSVYASYRGHFNALDPPAGQLDWFHGFPDLSDEDVLASWKEDTNDEGPNRTFEEKVLLRLTKMKAKMRAILWGFSFRENTPNIRDLAKSAWVCEQRGLTTTEGSSK